MTKPRVSVIVTDLDNTLYDWFEIWYSSFRPMLDVLIRESGIDENTLKAEIRAVHRRFGTAEFSRLISELPSLRELHPNQDLMEVYRHAIDAFRAGRRASLRLYPTVFETLWHLKKAGCLIIGYTESRAYYTNYRVRRLCLDGLLDYLHSPADHELPGGVSREEIRRYAAEDYELKVTRHEHTPEGEYKPNPHILLNIIHSVGAKKEDAIYVGDHELKDVTMALDAGVIDVWASYGAVQHKEQYKLLQDVSHWTDADIAREMEIKRRGKATASYVLRERFGELLELFEFEPFQSAPP